MVVITTTRTTTPGGSAAMASPFAITTTFSAPAACAQASGGLTILQNKQYEIWLNEPVPVPGTTITSCYPSQFISSYLLEKGGVTQSAFSPLVCPSGYTTQGPFTSNYIACCPSGWDGIALASGAPSNRPAYSGTCYTNIYNKPIKVTQYNDVSIQASSLFTATDSLAQAYAYPYEGFAFGVAQVASTTPTNTPSSSSSSSSTPTSTASSTSAPASAQTSSSSVTTSSSSGLSGGAIAGIVIGVLAGVALLALALFALLRYRRRRLLGGPEVPPYEPEMQYHAQDPNAAAAGASMAGNGMHGADTTGGATMASADGSMGVDKKLYPEAQMASEMEAKHIPQEMPEEPQRWHELESPPPAA